MDLSTWSAVPREYDPLKAGSIDGTDVDPHDRAIFRAMHAKYKPNKDVTSDPHCTIFVARLSPNTDEEMLENVFSDYGEIKRLRLVRDIVTGHSRCYAFIEYVKSSAASRAERDANKMILDEKEIFVDFEHERTLKGWIPRRLGGGIGGKKESGQLRFGGKDRPFHKPLIVDPDKRSEGGTFRERLKNTDLDRGRDRNYDRYRQRQRDRSRDRYRDSLYEHSRSDYKRSRDREGRSKDRSRSRGRGGRSRDRSRSRDREGKSRDRSRSRDRNRRSRSHESRHYQKR